MAIPSLPPKGSTDWYAWAQGLQGDLTDRLSDAELRAASDARYALKANGFAQIDIYRQPTDPGPDVPVGAPYTWFQTDPTTGAVVDWLEGIGEKVGA